MAGCSTSRSHEAPCLSVADNSSAMWFCNFSILAAGYAFSRRAIITFGDLPVYGSAVLDTIFKVPFDVATTLLG